MTEEQVQQAAATTPSAATSAAGPASGDGGSNGGASDAGGGGGGEGAAPAPKPSRPPRSFVIKPAIGDKVGYLWVENETLDGLGRVFIVKMKWGKEIERVRLTKVYKKMGAKQVRLEVDAVIGDLLFNEREHGALPEDVARGIIERAMAPRGRGPGGPPGRGGPGGGRGPGGPRGPGGGGGRGPGGGGRGPRGPGGPGGRGPGGPGGPSGPGGPGGPGPRREGGAPPGPAGA